MDSHVTTFRSYEYTHEKELPEGHANEIRTPETLVEEFLEEYPTPVIGFSIYSLASARRVGSLSS